MQYGKQMILHRVSAYKLRSCQRLRQSTHLQKDTSNLQFANRAQLLGRIPFEREGDGCFDLREHTARDVLALHATDVPNAEVVRVDHRDFQWRATIERWKALHLRSRMVSG